jgi:hypothetical protein
VTDRPIIRYPPINLSFPRYQLPVPVNGPASEKPDRSYELNSDLANITSGAAGNKKNLLVLEHRFDVNSERSATTLFARYGVDDHLSLSLAGSYISPYKTTADSRPGFAVSPQLRVWGTAYSSDKYKLDIAGIVTGQYDSSSPGDPGSANAFLATSFKWLKTDSSIDFNTGFQGTFGSRTSPGTTGYLLNLAITQKWLSAEFNYSYLTGEAGSTKKTGFGLAFRPGNQEATDESRHAGSVYISPYFQAISEPGRPMNFVGGLGVTSVLGLPFF